MPLAFLPSRQLLHLFCNFSKDVSLLSDNLWYYLPRFFIKSTILQHYFSIPNMKLSLLLYHIIQIFGLLFQFWFIISFVFTSSVNFANSDSFISPITSVYMSMVVEYVACPITDCTTFGLMPASKHLVQNVLLNA